MKKFIIRILIVVWIVMWAGFAVRELVGKGQLKEYKKLINLSLEGKHSYITGKELYELVALANGILPEGASYKLIGIEPGSLEQRRAAYYLYPAIEKEDADYLIIYNTPGFSAEGYSEIKRIDGSRMILMKTGAK